MICAYFDSFPLNVLSLSYKKSTSTVSSSAFAKVWNLHKGPLFAIPSIPPKLFFIRKSSNNFLIFYTDLEPISIWDLENNTLLTQINTSNCPLKCIQVQDTTLTFSILNEIKIFDLSNLSLTKTLNIHTNPIKKLLLYKNHLLSLSDLFAYSNIDSGEDFVFIEKKAKNFYCTENLNYGVLISENNTKLWDLYNKTELFYLGRGKSDRLILTTNQEFLIYSHYEVPMKNWNRLRKKNPSIDVVKSENMEVEIGISYKISSQFSVWGYRILYYNSENLFQNWRIRKIDELGKNLVTTSCCQADKFIYVGTNDGFLYMFDEETVEEIMNKEIHEGDVILIVCKKEFLVTGSTDETICVCKKEDLGIVFKVNLSGLADFCCLEKEIVAVSLYGDVKYWSFPGGEEIFSLNYNSLRFTGVKFISSTLIISCRNKGIYTSSLYLPLQIWSELSETKLTSLASSDKYIAVGCLNNSILYWSVSETLNSLSHNSDPPKFNEISGNAYEINLISFDSFSNNILYLTGDSCRIWNIKSSRHIFSYDCVYSCFLNGLLTIKCIYSQVQKTKVLEILPEDTKAFSKKFILLAFFKRKFKIY